MRVHELAKELGITSKDLIKRLANMGVSVKSHMSQLDDATMEKVKKRPEPAPPPTEKPLPVKAPTEPTPAAVEVAPKKKLRIEFPITAKELALRLKLKPNELISKLISLGVFASINQNLDRDVVEIVLH